jgi:hypothetical protein
MTEEHRHQRHTTSPCVTCAGQNYRHQRHTPLGGVTIVTLTVLDADLVPMPPFHNPVGGAGVGLHSTHTARWQE